MITTCREIIYDEFSFDSAFASLAQLSSEDRGLVDKRPVERKHMINSIVNSLDTFNEIYKNINKKYNTLKSLINNLISKIDLIGSEAQLSAALKNINTQLDNLEKAKQNAIENTAGLKIKIADVESVLNEFNYNEIVNELNANLKIISNTQAIVDNTMAILGVSSVDELNEKYKEISKATILLETDIDRLKTDISSILSKKESEVGKLHDKHQQLEAIKSGFNHTNIKQSLEEFKAKALQYEAIFHEMGLNNISLITKDEFNMAMRSIDNLRNNAHIVMHNYDLSMVSRDIMERPLVIEMINSYKDTKNRLNMLNSELSEVNKQIIIYNTKREIASELVNRPKGCKIDSCVYISEALKADREYPESARIQLFDKQKELETEVKQCSDYIEDIESAMTLRQQISNIEKELNDNIHIIMKLPVRSDFKDTFLSRMLNFDPFDDITELYKYIDCGNMLQEYQILMNNIKTYETEYKLYESKQTIIESILNDVNQLESEINSIVGQIESMNNDIMTKKKQLIDFTSLSQRVKDSIDKYNNTIMPLTQKTEELQRTKSELAQSVEVLEAYKTNLQTTQKSLDSIASNISTLTKQRENITHGLLMLEQYNTELAEYKKQSMMLERIRYHSSPSSGIQTVYISIFMNKILSTANQLLSLLFGGVFVLQNFIVNDSEFRIPILGEGLLHDDISSMSSAQKALISMIISFSLLHQSSTKYNIITLDEIDGPLDNTNRFAFINLLDNLMGILQCEQAFIVSHNNELDSSLCDIIMLKNDSNETVNGNVIWSF